MSMKVVQAADPQSIREMFNRIAPAYDRTNDFLSFGIHKLWKRTLVKSVAATGARRVLDCATGTGDLAFGFESISYADVVGVDFSSEMLEVARRRAAELGSRVVFETADTCALPHKDASFDAASISFGIRNTRDPGKALSEMARVVRPGGTVAVLEFGRPRNPLMGALYGFYSRVVLPRVGGWISGDPGAYRYLQESSSKFPDGEEFVELASATGRLVNPRVRAFQSGVAFLYLFEVRLET